MLDAVRLGIVQNMAALAARVPSPESCGCAARKAKGLRASCMFILQGDESACRAALGEKVWAWAEGKPAPAAVADKAALEEVRA